MVKIAHTSITVKNMEESIKFYRDVIGLKFVSRREIPENKAEIAFVEGDGGGSLLELTFWSGKKDWVDGDQLDHIALAVPSVEKAVQEFKRKGVEIAKEPYSLQGSKHKIAFIKDPNGIWIELVEQQ